ncbi:uncharacterized protein LOC119784395 isoform X1 [Cyprinodon tularosa]|uniref:uncharacterized protein LOC119784395 isoform X1 n=1 Tax=Cyprinodon tularosa TaxID=77115 RepID=UPI0018E21E8C|nr:uncharacterized protein LOC119784395 isoform X1 [Cyprinodon tularosa]
MSQSMNTPSLNDSVTKGQYGLPTRQTDVGICRTLPNVVPGSSLNLIGASGNPSSFGTREIIPNVGPFAGGFSLPVRNWPEPSQTTSNINLHSTFNICAREQIMYQPVGQGALFGSTQRGVSLSATTETSYLASSATQGHLQPSGDCGGSSSYNYSKSIAVQPTGQTLSHAPVCTPAIAEKILLSYGLQKEDLYELINCPDEETTAENLPYTLQKIRMKNANRASSAVTSASASQPTTDRLNRLDSYGQPKTIHNEMPSDSSKTVEMTQYGHTGECSPHVEDKTFDIFSKAQACGNNSLVDNFKTNSQNKEGPEKNSELKPTGLITSNEHVTSVISLSSAKNVVAPAQLVNTQSNQTLQSTCPALAVQKKNWDISKPESDVFGFPPAKASISHIKTKTHTESTDAKAQSKTQDQGSKTLDITPQQTPQKPVPKQTPVQMTQPQKTTALESLSPYSCTPTVTDVSHSIQPSGISPVYPNIPSLDLVKTTDGQGSTQQSAAKPATFKGLPSLAKMHDYTATKPKTFPHTCSLCRTNCSHIKDWIGHQQTILHLGNCKLLRDQYPEWDGKVTPQQCNVIRKSRISPSASAQTSQGHQKRTSDGSRCHSRSRSPRRCHTSRNRRESTSSSSSSESPHRRRSSRRRKASTSSSSRSCSPRRRRSSRRRRASSSSSSRSRSPRRRCSSGRRRASSSSSSRSRSPRRRRSSGHGRGSSSSSSSSPRRCQSSRHRMGSSSSTSRSHNTRNTHSSEDQREKRKNRTQSLYIPRRICRSRSRSYSPKTSCHISGRRILQKESHKKPGSPTRSSKPQSLTRINDKKSSPRKGGEPRRSPKKGAELRPTPHTNKERPRLEGSDDEQRSRSPKRPLSPKSDETKESRGRSRERRCLPNKSIKQDLPKASSKKQQSPGKIVAPQSVHDDRPHSLQKSCKTQSLQKINDGEQTSSKKSEKLSSVNGSRKRQLSLEESSSQKKKSCTEDILKDQALNSVPEQLNNTSLIQPLVDAAVVEQAKIRAPSPIQSSFTSPANKKEASTSSRGSSPTSASSLPSSKPVKSKLHTKWDQIHPNVPRTEASLQTTVPKPQFSYLGKPSPPTMLRLKGNFDSLSHGDVIASMECFGKTKSLLLFKSKQEATVCFEKEEDAAKLKSTENFEIKGVPITFVSKQDSVSGSPPSTAAADQKNPSPEKPTVSCQPVSGGNLVHLPSKTLLSLQSKSKRVAAVKLLKKAKVLVSKERSVSKKQGVQTLKAVILAKTRSLRSVKGKKDALKPEKIPKSKKNSGQKSNGKLKANGEDSGNVKKKTGKPSNGAAGEKHPGKESVTKAETATKHRLEENNESSASKAKKQSVTNFLQIDPIEEDPPRMEKIEDVAAKSVNTSDPPTLKAEISKSNIEEFAAEPKNPVVVLARIREITKQGHVGKVTEMKNLKEAELLELEKTGGAGSMEVDPVVKKELKLSTDEASPPKLKDAQLPIDKVETIADKPSPAPPLRQEKITKSPEMSAKALVQMTAVSKPDSTAQNLTSLQTGGSSAETPAVTMATVQREETKAKQIDTFATAKTQTTPPQASVPTLSPKEAKNSVAIKTSLAKSKMKSTVPTCPADTSITAGEQIVPVLNRLKLNSQEFVLAESILPAGPLTVDSTLLLITNLPMYNSCRYTEEEVVTLLCKFGFQYAHDNIYIFPQGRMAFVLMPNERSVIELISASAHNHLIFKKHKLCLFIVKKNIFMTPLGFYKSIMALMSFKVEAPNTIYIQNISPSDTIDVREALGRIKSVRNFLTLLNKVFIEFDSIYDADRLGIWYSLMKVGFTHVVERLRLPRSNRKSQPPKLPLNALPDEDEIIAGAEMPDAKYGIPQGTNPPFWVTMTTIPYVFPTASPWFNIPDFLTIRGKKALTTTPHPGSAHCTIMLTGLPEGNYKHEDIVAVVGCYFPEQNLRTLYYNILVLPLQRRAFVFFCDRKACCSFVLDHVKKPVSIRDCVLTVHFVLQDIRPRPSEEIMYRVMMKWSNAHVPELDFLENRLLCVEIFEFNVDLVKNLMKEVASIASFVNFLPLSNRICIEMLESSGVKKVLEEIAFMEDLSKHRIWSKVGRVESLKSLKKRIEDSEKVPLNVEGSSSAGGAESPVVQSAALPPPSETSHNVAQSESAEASSSTEATVSKSDENRVERGVDAPSDSGLEEKSGERFTNLTEGSKTERRAADWSQKGEDINTLKCKATPAGNVADPNDISKPEERPEEQLEKEPNLGVSAGPVKVSETEEEFVQRAPHPPSLPQQEDVPKERAAEAPNVSKSSEKATPPETLPKSEKTAEDKLSPETLSAANQPCKKDSSTAAAVCNVSAVLAEPSAAVVKTQPKAAAPANQKPAAADPHLTVGEKLETLLNPDQILCLEKSVIMSKKFYSNYTRLLLISNLPKYYHGCYSESDVADLFKKFGFHYEQKNIYVIPQACMAFVLMPNFRCAQNVFTSSQSGSFTLIGSKLCVQIVTSKIFMEPLEFYKSLMELVGFPVKDDGTSTIYIQNISPSETLKLRETLRKMDSVKNILPLLNKVFVEFESARDADRIGVWYSLLKRCPAHKVQRMKLPRGSCKSQPPRLALKALPDSVDMVTGAVVPVTSFGVPPGSIAPFSVTLMTDPFIFPTTSPWFIIPNFSTIKTKRDMWTPASKAKKSSTIMLTCLPEGNYKHEDIAKLVWSYFPKQNLQTLLYNIVVLPLQRRAFVHFNDWNSCCSFVENFLKCPASIKDQQLYVHQVLQEMPVGLSEEIMYRNLMKWSNSHVPELESLEERLVLVVLSEISVYLIGNVLRKVASIAPLVSFLPLANRICIEMEDPSSVTLVQERISQAPYPKEWANIRCVETVKSLKRRLNDCAEITLNLELDNKDIWTRTGKREADADVSGEKRQPDAQQPAEHPDVVSTGKEDVASETKTPLTSKENLSETEVRAEEKSGATQAEDRNVPPRSTVSEKEVCVSGKVEESVDEATDTGSKAVPEQKKQAEMVKDDVQPECSTDAKSSELKETALIQNSTEAKEEVKPETGPHKPVTSLAQGPQTTTQEVPVKTPAEVQESRKPNPGPSLPEAEQKTKAVTPDQQQTSGTSAFLGRSASKADGGLSLTKPVSAFDKTAATCLTPGEKMEIFLNATTAFKRVSEAVSSSKFLFLSATLVISNLPEFRDGCYTEAEVISLLQNSGVGCEDEKVFIVPQSRTAFVFSPNMKEVQKFLLAKKSIFLKGSKLSFCVIENPKPPNIVEVYKFLVSFTTIRNMDPKRVVYIQNISATDAKELREELKKIGSVINYLPLLNKVFVEFQTYFDCDRFGVYHSFPKHGRPFSLYRLDGSTLRAKAPRMPALRFPDLAVIKDRAVIPKGCRAPLWVTMTTRPFLFPTATPWFIIPAYWQQLAGDTIKKCKLEGLIHPTVMLSGLPNETYTHQDVAALVFKYFPEQNLPTLHYNVMVLPLQKRAFVCFSSWVALSRFFQDHPIYPVVLKGSHSFAYLVKENISPAHDEVWKYENTQMS